MRLLVTGLIAGMDDKKLLKDTVININKVKNCSFINVFKELEESGNKRLDRMLTATNYLFQTLREREYLRTGFILEKEKSENAIIRTSATVLWNGVSLKFKDQNEIKKYIKPDVIITLIDEDWTIAEKIKQYSGDHEFENKIKKQKYAINEVLTWMNDEVSVSEDWANFMNIPHYVIPIQKHKDELYKFMIYDNNLPKFYVSYSMTYCNQKGRKEIDDIIERLRKHGIVIDPQGIEIPNDIQSDTTITNKEKDLIRSFTVHRDLHWFVGKVDAVIALHPYTTNPPFASGMIDEIGHARDYLKDRFMIFGSDSVSPFITHSYIEKDKVFKTSDELFEYLNKKTKYRELK